MELVQFKARCRKCQEELRITLDQARADQSIACTCGDVIQAREAIENELIDGVNQGCGDYFECLVRIFDRDLRGAIVGTLRLCLRPDLTDGETEDALQEVFFDLWKKGIHKVNEGLTAYLRGVAAHKAIDRMRKRQDKRFVPWDSIIESKAFDSSDEKLVRGFPVDELLEMLAQALLTLSEEQRTVFQLRLIEGQSTKEVAQLLSIESGTVKSRLSRAKEQIREFLLTAVSVRSVP